MGRERAARLGIGVQAQQRAESRAEKSRTSDADQREEQDWRGEDDIAEVTKQLQTTRLLALIGSGGVRKTRLALQVASEVLADYADGVWWVEFAALADPALVPQSVATALGVSEGPGRPILEVLTEFLYGRSLLLMLDNCEHLIEACARLADALLRACPNLTILATSRERLGVDGEVVYRVPSLSFPDPQRLPPREKLLDFEAVRLFVERAGAVATNLQAPDLTVKVQNARPLAQVCHQLDCIPLAIEMAAAQVSALSVHEIAVELDDRFAFLMSGSRTALPRHQTLRATLDWSYHLLSPAEQVLLARLSVVSGGWTVDAARVVCADGSDDILPLLLQLVHKSLVVAEQRDGHTRYRLLETIREYALEKLRETGEDSAIRQRHLAFFVQFAEQPWLAAAHARTDWLNRLEPEQNNFRAAIDWALAHGETTSALRLVWELADLWDRRKRYRESRAQLSRVLAQTSTDMRTLERARVLTLLSSPSFNERYLEAGPMLEEAIAIAQHLEDEELVAYALRALGFNAFHRRDFVSERSCYEQALAIWRELGDKAGICSVTWCLGMALITAGDYQQAQTLLQEGLSLSEEVGAETARLDHLYGLGRIAFYRGDYAQSRALFEEGLRSSIAADEAIDIHWYQEAFANLSTANGQFIRAARLIGAREAIMETRGTSLAVTPLARV